MTNNVQTSTLLQTKPNLFKYATSELSQDAFLCWLFEHVSLKTDDIGYGVAKRLLERIIDKAIYLNPDLHIQNLLDSTLKIDQQVHKIDVLLTFEAKTSEDKVYILIEDKTFSGESRKNQSEHYKKKLKINKPTDVIIPVLFKTGYTSKQVRENFAKRQIIFIGYQDIYDVFLPFVSEVSQDVILNSWWLHFHETYYTPITRAKSLSINAAMALGEYNKLVKENNIPHSLAFKKITEYLFYGFSGHFSTKMFRFQGKGHIDWHYGISKLNWTNQEKKISINVYFVWDTYKFSLVVKTAPHPYKRRKQLTEIEKQEYVHVRDEIKKELRKNKLVDWKITNYYLQIAYVSKLNDVQLETLKTKLTQEILLIADEIDRVMNK